MCVLHRVFWGSILSPPPGFRGVWKWARGGRKMKPIDSLNKTLVSKSDHQMVCSYAGQLGASVLVFLWGGWKFWFVKSWKVLTAPWDSKFPISQQIKAQLSSIKILLVSWGKHHIISFHMMLYDTIPYHFISCMMKTRCCLCDSPWLIWPPIIFDIWRKPSGLKGF